MKKRERRNWKSKEKWGLTLIADVSYWVVQFLSIGSIEWLGLKKLHTVQYPRYCTGCESTSKSYFSWRVDFECWTCGLVLSGVKGDSPISLATTGRANTYLDMAKQTGWFRSGQSGCGLNKLQVKMSHFKQVKNGFRSIELWVGSGWVRLTCIFHMNFFL